jgi:hypothetical protein
VLNKARFPSPGGAQGDSLPVDDPLKGNEKGVYSAYTPTDDLKYVAQALEEDVFFSGERVFDINDQGDHLS